MEIRLHDRVIDGKYQWFYFLILDINDFFGGVFTFVLDSNLTIINFHIDFLKLRLGSTKYHFGILLQKLMNERDMKDAIAKEIKS